MKNFNKKFLVVLFAGLLMTNSLVAAEKADTDKGLEEKAKKAGVHVVKKLAVELERLIEARESVDKVYIQVDKPVLGTKAKTTATVLVQPDKSPLSAEELNKIKVLISAAVDELDVKDISIVEINFNELKRKFQSDIKKAAESAKAKDEKSDKKDKKDRKDRKDKKEKVESSDKSEKADKAKKDDKKEDKKEENKDSVKEEK